VFGGARPLGKALPLRRATFARMRAVAVVCALTAFEPPARGDEPALAPPKLAHFVDAADPRDPGAPRASVELELEIDRDGNVGSARVVRSGGDDLDRAALDAVNAFIFDAATRDGAPVAARIRYEYVFAARAPAPTPTPEPAPVATASARVVLRGVALDRDDGAPLDGAEVTVTSGDGAARRVKADARGVFRLDDVPAGTAYVVIRAEGHVPARSEELLEPGTMTELTLRLEPTPDPEAFVATARVEAPAREVTRRTLGREEMSRVAGTRGDPIRAVELLPGVSRADAGGGNPILRGANPADSQVYLEGAPVPLLYHFGGLSSFVHSRVTESVDLYPSNFSVRYGRKVGGVVEVRLRDPRTDALHGIADVSLIDSSLVVETPLGDQVSVLAAARRSNLDAVLNSAASTTDLAITTAPVYWDYQSVAAYKPTERDRFRLLAYGSSDRFAILLKKPSDSDPAVRGAFEQATTFHRVQLGYRHRFRGGSEQNTELTFGRSDLLGAFGTLGRTQFVVTTLQGRSEWSAVVSKAVKLVAGLDVVGNHFNGSYAGIPPTADEGAAPPPLSTQKHVSVSAFRWIVQPGAYLEAGLRPLPNLLLVPGLRGDYSDLVGRGSIDPRLSARWELTEHTAVKAGIGRFSQPPLEEYAVDPIGNPNLRLTRSTHASAGLEQKLGEHVSVSAEGFAKWIDAIVTSTPGGRPPFFENTQSGRVFGGELLVRVKPTGRFFGFLSYTMMRSERRDTGQPWRLFDRDQPHILGAAAAYRLGRGWEVGASLRYTSGNPYTPVVSSSYDASSDLYVPRRGPVLSARNPAFSRLDLRVEKKWSFTRWNLAVYLDVQNLLNAENREGYDYSYDYRRREGVRGLPILPSLGIRGEL
jgi:TonB family protein